MFKKRLFIIFFSCGFLLNAQVVNIEGLRKASDSTRFFGKVGLDIDFTKNVNTAFNLSNNIVLQYAVNKNTFLFLNKFDFREVNDQKFTNKSIQHLRYNYRFYKKVSFESFLQFQKDKVSFINYRTLAGLGTRFKVHQTDKNSFFIGTLFMYEYENSVGITNNIIEQTTRGDFYVSFDLRPKKSIIISSTTYYQPKIEAFNDYRISSETSLRFSLFKNLDFTTTFSYQFDVKPVFGIPKEQYKLENGITYNF